MINDVVAKKLLKKLLTTEMIFDKILNVATKGSTKFGLWKLNNASFDQA